MVRRDRFRRFGIVFGMAFLLLIILLLSALFEIQSVSGQSLGQNYKDPPVKPVCSEESLRGRPPHPPELTSCDEVVVWQNQIALELLDLPKLDEAWLDQLQLLPDEELLDKHNIVRLKNTAYYKVDRINPRFRIVYKYVADYLLDLSQRYYFKYHKRLEVVSAARTKEWHWLITQKYINGRKNKYYNPNAFTDPDNPNTGSMHTFLIAFDISLRRMNSKQKIGLQQMLISDTLDNQGIQHTEESVWIYKRRKPAGSRVVAYHSTIFNTSFLTLYSKPVD